VAALSEHLQKNKAERKYIRLELIGGRLLPPAYEVRKFLRRQVVGLLLPAAVFEGVQASHQRTVQQLEFAIRRKLEVLRSYVAVCIARLVHLSQNFKGLVGQLGYVVAAETHPVGLVSFAFIQESLWVVFEVRRKV
jgi:hypothetical protein